MDFDRLGLNPAQQSEIDDMFLGITIDALNQKSSYREHAWLMTTSPELPDELESIQLRTFDQVHIAIAENQQINPIYLTNLAKLAFIDTLSLPSSEIVGEITNFLERRKLLKPELSESERGLGDWWNYRRLFKGLPNSF